MKKLTNGEIYKFEKEGDIIVGEYIGHSESKKYSDSYAVKIKKGNDILTVFVNNIVVDLIESNDIKKDMVIGIKYLGKKTAKTSGKEYNDYEVSIDE